MFTCVSVLISLEDWTFLPFVNFRTDILVLHLNQQWNFLGLFSFNASE